MVKTFIASLAIVISGAATAQSVKPEYIKSMTYGQCKADATVRMVAGMYKQKYPSATMEQILHIICKDAK